MTDYVMSLLANPAIQPLPPELVQTIAGQINATQVRWRAPGEACDIYFSKADALRAHAGASKNADIIEQAIFYVLDTVALALSVAVGESEAVYLAPPGEEEKRSPVPKQVQHEAEHAVEAYKLDVIVQNAALLPKKLLICDMDSTMITCECIDELADFIGKKAEVSAITERAMNGELDFAQALTRRVRLLEGLDESVLQQCYDERVKMSPGAKELVAHMGGAGAVCVLVSGGFTFFTSRVAAELGFQAHYANELEIENGKLTGNVKMPILGKEAKLQTLRDYCKKLDIRAEEVLAIGDGANDLPMLLAAGLGVAYHAKPVVQRHAKARLNYCDLSALKWVVAE